MSKHEPRSTRYRINSDCCRFATETKSVLGLTGHYVRPVDNTKLLLIKTTDEPRLMRSPTLVSPVNKVLLE
jgi:hypothetical protein